MEGKEVESRRRGRGEIMEGGLWLKLEGRVMLAFECVLVCPINHMK